MQQQDYLPEEFYTSLLSKEALERKPSPIRSLYPLEKPPVLSLLSGKPNPKMFPIKSLSFTAQAPPANGGHDLGADSEMIETDHHLSGEALAEALQYSASAGLPRLVEWFTDFQVYEHGRERDKDGRWRVSVGIGSQDLLYKALHALVDDGDAVLVESPTYAVTIPILEELHVKMIPIPTDSEGIQPKVVASILDNWPKDGPRKPRVLYTIPYGGNPSGITSTLPRRLQLLALARKHKFIIIEDDPYYYLYFGSSPRPPSYFSLETRGLDGKTTFKAGYVLRLDSFSKVISSGIRIGFVTGPEPILRIIDLHTGISNLQTPGLTQAVVYSLLETWGVEGFVRHTEVVSGFYKEKRDVFEGAMRKYMSGLAEWDRPEAGLFFWFKLLIKPTPESEDGDSEVLIRTKALEKGVLALPGAVFLPDRKKSAYVRAAFSLLEEHEVDEAVRRLTEVVREEQKEVKK